MDVLLHLVLLLDVTHFNKFLCYQILLYDTFKYFIIMYYILNHLFKQKIIYITILRRDKEA